jgi:hypothetical protein
MAYTASFRTDIIRLGARLRDSLRYQLVGNCRPGGAPPYGGVQAFTGIGRDLLTSACDSSAARNETVAKRHSRCSAHNRAVRPVGEER